MRRDTKRAYQARVKAFEDTLTEARNHLEARHAAGVAEVKAERAAMYAPVPFTDDQWAHARLVRTGSRWHSVTRVNAKSVTVATGYSWTDRIARSRVDEVRP